MHTKRAVMIIDGECGFCTTVAGWISARWPAPATRVVAYQELGPGELDRYRLCIEDVRRSVWWIERDRSDGGSRAVARALLEARGVLALLGRIILTPPFSWVAPYGYRLVARYRHRLVGATASCRVSE
jgi:predicted DCC family thiol-disulfide oxidoreductase YuxK